jgi:hydrogenase expression/formation protein HypC
LTGTGRAVRAFTCRCEVRIAVRRPTQSIHNPGEGAMCLGIPARVTKVTRYEGIDIVEGTVDFSGVQKQVNLSFTPEVEEGDWVVVHVGFSISVLDEQEALTTLAYLRELGEMEAAKDQPST